MRGILTFYLANKRIVKNDPISDESLNFLIKFWTLVSENITQWNELEQKEISKVDLRENYIITQAVVIQSLGRIGRYFYMNKDLDMGSYISLLKEIDWKRSSPNWELRTIRANGRMINNDAAIILTANIIKQKLNIPLGEDEIDRENILNKN